ncbi:tyrosine n-monooxygenase [Hordeum vulgare]|nr:tyrosine n-monooxygenase [Hordeum vulgare]
MDGSADNPSTTPYARDPLSIIDVVVAAANICTGWTSDFTAGEAPTPSTDLAHDHFMALQMNPQGKKTKKGRVKKGRAFVFPHCYKVLKDEDKWNKHDDDEEETKKGNIDAVVLDDDEEEALSDGAKRSPTPNSVAYSKPKRPSGVTKEKKKKKKGGNDDIKNCMKAIVMARKEENERRVAAEDRRVVAEEKKMALEEKELAREKKARMLEHEKHLLFMDTSKFNDMQKQYINLCRDKLLVPKMMGFGCTRDTMGGFSGMGATMGGFRGM